VLKERGDGVLLSRLDGTTAVLTLNRPEARNAFSAELLHMLREALIEASDDERVRAVVITGAGDRAFCAGADIRAMQAMSVDQAREWSRLGHDVFQTLDDLPLPTIAAVNGVAAGGGCEVALSCDFRLAAEGALIGQPEIKLGLIPGWGGTQRLPRLVGPSRALDLVLTGRLVDAAEALRMGLVDRLAPSGESVLSAALVYAKQFGSLPPLALRYAKRAMRVGRDLDLREANGLEIEAFSQAFDTEDRVEGLAAFVEKRGAEFKGR
jgi:enoyl-CoA hydratase